MSEHASFESYFIENDELIYSNVGVSMMPLLRQGRDLFIVRKKGRERCRTGDVVLFRRGSDYVLHRIVKVLDHGYDILGDNSIEMEKNIKEEDVLAVMTGFVRNGKSHRTDELGYRIYSFLILKTAAVRILLKRLRRSLVRLIKGGK